MALIKCPECGKMLSEYAERCPKCGLSMTQIKEKEVALAKQKEQQKAKAAAKLKAQQEAEAAAKQKEQQEAETVATATNSPSSIDEDTKDDYEKCEAPWYIALPWCLCGVLIVAIILILCSRHNNNTNEVVEVADSCYVDNVEEYEEIPEVMAENESDADEDARAMLTELITQIVNKNNEIYDDINKEYFNYELAIDSMDNILRNYCTEGMKYWYTNLLEELDREEASGEGPGRAGDGPNCMTDYFLHIKDEEFAIWDEICLITDWEIKGLCTVGDNGAAIVSYTKKSCYKGNPIHNFFAIYRLERSDAGNWEISEINGYNNY